MPTEQRVDMNECVVEQIKARGLGSRYDAGETASFARELEWIQAQAIEAKFPELVGVNLVPIIGGAVFPGARAHTFRNVTGFGEAELLEGMTPEDFPAVDVQGKETTGTFRNFGVKYHVTIEDLKAKLSMSIDVEAQKGKIARKVSEQKLDRLILTGGGPFTGLLQDASSIDDTSGDDWETGTEAGDVAAVLATFRRVLKNARVATNGVFQSYDFILSTLQWEKMALFIPATTAGGGMTVMDFLLRYVPGVRSITHCNRCDGAGAGGKDRMLAYPRDPEVLDCLVPERFTQFAPQLEGMTFTTYCSGKYGGIRIYHPKAIRRVDVTMT